MLELRDIHLVYNAGTSSEVEALKGLSLSIPAEEFVTVVGSNGAGKSSLVQIISGAASPSAGRVLINGTDVTGQREFRRARSIARVFDNPHAGTATDLSIEDNMALALARGRRRNLGFAVNSRRRKLMSERLAMLGLGLDSRLATRVALLSAGQRQSLTMVMAGLTQPEVLLLDEHLAALDPRTQAKVLDLTVAVARELRCTTIMITHNMEHAIAVGDRLIVMSHGQVQAEFAGEEKRSLTPRTLIQHIIEAGDVVTDRMALAGIEGVGG
ncbi:Energy-coupling factor transporter ATP-binding protein EcfA2 [Baekduia alba]|uniref:ABC transporter ATP-binding protein n=1 Tax=Baekduia alba TaxID=2997333 RepID=UPI0023413A5A|nr:ATP-binding cassette domain-containing protein [Baekduia alba]WCB93350.1 Energy-coupling factor transporter ATP-binding protein EcfA2 [Baekduia alba]